MTVTVEHSTSEELRQRHREVLRRVGMTREEIGELAAQYTLTPEELAAWDELRSIEFLLEDA
ncbi:MULTISPECIES: hypothetical protein [Nocardia]|uniref:Uncharacterized protein n=2 Tax=Nocardia TaxID=1817 RepID=A0ABW7WRE5_9NOCA|nr:MULTISPECIES: hypothetical protein [unclassified Nocardia]MBF6196077.1 hypothetical protein [Nocardia beijingensis]MEA3532549.1 hypothetical protein [Nocardia sp. CDC192]MEB3514418.1 hypothetical protein [Nocardia sp. CDC186]